MAYSDITSAETDPESPLTTTLMVKYVDNLLQVEQWIRDRLDDQLVSNWDILPVITARHFAIWYNAGVWIFGGVAALIRWSTDDGLHWTAPSASGWGGGDSIFGIFHDGNTMWATCGTDAGNRGVATSVDDGDNWIIRDANIAGNAGRGITHDLSGLWVVVADGGKISSSTDGITWVAEVSGIATSLNAVCYGNGMFVAVGDAGEILTSPGGVPGALVWTQRVSGFGASHIYGVRWGGDKFVAVGEDSKYTTSSDGLTWAIGDFGLGAGVTFYAVAYDDERWVAVGDVTGVVFTSASGTAWANRPNSYDGNEFWAVARNGADRWIIATEGGDLLATHFDPNRQVIP